MTNRALPLIFGAVISILGAALAADPIPKPDCGLVLDKLAKDIASDATRVLLYVEDALTVNEACACEIVKTAITASRSDPMLTGEIVSSAVNAAPRQASTIGECALAAAPAAAKEIKKAMEAALGAEPKAGASEKVQSEESSSGKQPVSGKQPITTETRAAQKSGSESDEWSEFGSGAMTTHGIYLSSPASSGLSGEEEVIIKKVRSTIIRIRVRAPSSGNPATRS
jgi:hypothetical protein